MAKQNSTSVIRHPASLAAYSMCLFLAVAAHLHLGDLAWPLYVAVTLACLTIIGGLWFSKRQIGLATKRALMASHTGARLAPGSPSRNRPTGARNENDLRDGAKPAAASRFKQPFGPETATIYKSHTSRRTGDFSPLLASAKSRPKPAILDRSLPAPVRRRLNVLLSQTTLPMKDTFKTARDWTHRYRLLHACVTQLAETDERYAQAVQFLQRGQFTEVLGIIEMQFEFSQKHPNLLAADYFNLALLRDLEFKPALAITAYVKACKNNPNNPAYGFGLIRSLLELNQTKNLETHFRKALWLYRNLQGDAISPSLAYLAASSLNRMGLFYADEQNTDEAQAALSESLIIHRLLSGAEPSAYNPELARCLRDLAAFHQKMGRLEDAGSTYIESLDIHREMAGENPAAYLPELAKFLGCLGSFYRFAKLPDFAELALRESLEILDSLTRKNPAAYLPHVAICLHNMGNLYRAEKHLDKAEAAYRESLEIRRVLAKENPEGYLPEVSLSLNNLGALYRELQRFDETVTAYLESLEIRRLLAKQNPEVYLPELPLNLNNLGVLYRGARRLDEAEEAYRESLEISRVLAEKNPGVYLPYVAMTLNNLGLLYRETERTEAAEAANRESAAIRANLGMEKLAA